MNTTAQHFIDIGEPFASGFFEQPDASVAQKICRAYKRYYENCPMSYIEGAPLFPSGPIQNGDMAVIPQFCRQIVVNWNRLESKSPEAAEQFKSIHLWPGGYNHSTLHYKRIVEEGVNRYEERVRALEDSEFKEILLDVLDGLRTYHSRALDYLRSIGADDKLIDALTKVPFEPAQTAYEALVSCNFMLYLDGCDNIGRGDSWLLSYWKGEDLTDVLHCMMRNLQDNVGWSVTLGPDYNELTYQWIKASEGLARPMVQLRVTENMPDELWEFATKKVLTGGGQPSFYNEKAIQSRLLHRLPNARKEDIFQFVGVGCTEPCFQGMTHSGGIDINLNVLAVFEKHMKECLSTCKNFQEFYDSFCKRLQTAQDDIIDQLNEIYSARAKWSFAPIRTLFVDDCIDNQIGYYQGGARYNYAVPADSGIPNTIDSLLAIEELVYEKKIYTPDAFLKALEEQDPPLKARLLECPCYGVGDKKADALLHNLTSRFYSYYTKGEVNFCQAILPTSHQFNRHIEEGQIVGATPDGRVSGHPVADSIAAVNGKAVKGPTLMLLSASHFVQEEIYGIAVLNLNITRKYSPALLRALVEGYFALGGTQMQITCTTKEMLLEARENPDAHRDLIVRVGGFSEYFRNLTNELKDAVIERTLFED